MDQEVETELYHNGTTDITTKVGDVINNTQSSIADLLSLHNSEITLLKRVQNEESILNLILEEFSIDGFEIISVINSDIYHPVDAYNLMKRTSRTWTRINDRIVTENIKLRDDVMSTVKSFPQWKTCRKAVALGLLNIHQYYELEPQDLVNGILHDHLNNVTHTSKTRLGVSDAKLLSEIAMDDEETKNLVAAVQWLKVFPKLKKSYLKLAKYHDDLIINNPEDALSKRILTAEKPFESTINKDTDIKRLNDIEKVKCPMFKGSPTRESCLEFNRVSDIAKLCQVMRCHKKGFFCMLKKVFREIGV